MGLTEKQRKALEFAEEFLVWLKQEHPTFRPVGLVVAFDRNIVEVQGEKGFAAYDTVESIIYIAAYQMDTRSILESVGHEYGHHFRMPEDQAETFAGVAVREFLLVALAEAERERDEVGQAAADATRNNFRLGEKNARLRAAVEQFVRHPSGYNPAVELGFVGKALLGKLTDVLDAVGGGYNAHHQFQRD